MITDDFIDPEHTGRDRELLRTFYEACHADGGTADEITLRGIRAVLAFAQADRPAAAAPAAPAAGQRQALSPAKAMLKAFAADKYGIWLRGDPSRIAAAIRALANHAGSSKHWHADDLRTIAAELEGADG